MKFKFEKGVRIVCDLISHCYHAGALDYHIDMRIRKDISVYHISAPVPKMTEEDAARLRETLNTPRQREVEQNYWGLSGEPETGSELVLAGMMVDEAIVDLTDGVLTIIAKRLEE